MASEPFVRCAKCRTVLPEPPNTPLEKRNPCPTCGSTGREISVTGAIVATSQVTANVVVNPPAATARASAGSPQVAIGSLEDAGFDVQWLQLSEGGPWIVRVFDRQGEWIDGSVQDDPQDALLAVSERLLPPSEPAE